MKIQDINHINNLLKKNYYSLFMDVAYLLHKYQPAINHY